MRLVSAHVRNFRSLREISVRFGFHTALIGGNGAGKSSILKAIEKFYSTAKVLDADDYFGRDQSVPVEIELTFGDLTAQEATVFESRVRDGHLTVTRVFDGSTASGRYFGSVRQNADFSPIRAHLTAAPRIKAYRDLKAGNPVYAELPAISSATAAEDAMRVWEQAHPEQLTLQRDDGQFFGFQNAGRGALQKYTSFVFIPAVRDAVVDAADSKAGAIGRLLEIVVRGAILQRHDVQQFKAEVTARYQALVAPANMPELGLLQTRLTADLKGLYQEAEVGLAWREVSEFPVPLPVADVSLSDDGFGGPVDRQGHGLQRAFIITLLQYLARTTTAAAPVSGSAEGVESGEPAEPAGVPAAPNVILAIEEPELYQHPTKQRHFAEVLRKLSDATLPGVEGRAQVAFASHSPMFVSLGRAEEIRLVRRTDCDESDFKQCDIAGLSLDNVAAKLEVGWSKPTGTYSAASLVPRLHILGTELAEGFFANGVVLVEGRSDKAALAATARILGVSFEAAGIAILSAEGKENLDRPLVIFRELGIPTYVIWDCDKGQKDPKTATNLALLRLCRPQDDATEAPSSTAVCDCYAHFGETLEKVIVAELGEAMHQACLAAACIPFGISPSKDTQKIPEVMYQTLALAKQQGGSCPTLVALVRSIWQHMRGETIPEPAPGDG
jgi:putative ATP-dependent endonuclease of OLD family